MSRGWRYASTLAAALACMLLAAGVEAAQSRNVVVVAGSVEVDGVLDDAAWQRATWYEVTRETVHVENGAVSNFSGAFALLYDPEAIYVAFRAVDDRLVGARTGGDIWMDDCVELWFNWRQARQAAEPGYYQIGLAPLAAGGGPAAWVWRAAPGADRTALDGIAVRSSRTDDGWIVEARIARSGMDGAEPLPINATFNLSIVDRDRPGQGGDASWNHFTWNGMLHHDPNQFVRLEFR